MNKYSKYKSSGVEWIGEIPENWTLSKTSRVFTSISSGTTPDTEMEIYYQPEEINWVNTGDLNDGILSSTAKKISLKALEDYSTLKVYPIGTILIAMYGATIGKLSLIKIEACTNQACCALVANENLSQRFAYYWFLANKENIISLSYGGGQPNISQSTIRNFPILVPKKDEQQNIANYLDLKTSQIDILIKKKEELIRLFELKRQVVINDAVSKGLNPKAKMKDSGVEWIGEVPEEWEVTKLKYVSLAVQTGASPNGEKSDIYQDNGTLNWFTPGDLNGMRVNESKRKVTENARDDGEIKWFQRNSILLIGIGATLGKCALMETDGSANQQLNVITIDESKMLPEYALYFLASKEDVIKSLSSSSTLAIYTQTQTKNFQIVVPPFIQQNEISKFLNQYMKKTDELIKIISSQLTLLFDYRKSLIYEIATGKINIDNTLI